MHELCTFVLQNELTMAMSFYDSTLNLQSTFESARDRLLDLQCNIEVSY